MRIFRDINNWLICRRKISFDKSLGVVMTMGALHEGHFSLIRSSQKENDHTLVTIFLNPTQFNNKDDLTKYPKTMSEDINSLEDMKVDFLLTPDYEQIYPDKFRYKISESSLSKILCGLSRPGHFDGVLTVVMKLLQVAKADKAYFGEKDYQQYQLIKEMAGSRYSQRKG